MIKKFLSTDNNIASLPLRLALAVMLFPHGVQKITNFSGMVDILGNAYGLPAVIAILVILIEFLAPIAILLGIGTRIGALLIAVVMLGAIPYHFSNGFFMNWFGNQPGEGYQFHILAVGAAVALTLLGGGKWSLDLRLFKVNTSLAEN